MAIAMSTDIPTPADKDTGNYILKTIAYHTYSIHQIQGVVQMSLPPCNLFVSCICRSIRGGVQARYLVADMYCTLVG